MATLFRALADRTRLRLLNLMGDGDMCVCFFVEILGISQPNVSRHLAYLRQAGVVVARREGKWIHYRVKTPSDPHAAKLLADVGAWFAEDKEMKRDRKRLVNICCAPQLPIPLRGAPRPASLSLA
ncbi:MAG TPA: metalloregulator ArsR/SmtB family transcription factor [Blastocatellia bacterium]|nr:metalloregulator ArsR/SmtB family transcription factor [Blastocatellia bacterium]